MCVVVVEEVVDCVCVMGGCGIVWFDMLKVLVVYVDGWIGEG